MNPQTVDDKRMAYLDGRKSLYEGDDFFFRPCFDRTMAGRREVQLTQASHTLLEIGWVVFSFFHPQPGIEE